MPWLRKLSAAWARVSTGVGVGPGGGVDAPDSGLTAGLSKNPSSSTSLLESSASFALRAALEVIGSLLVEAESSVSASIMSTSASGSVIGLGDNGSLIVLHAVQGLISLVSMATSPWGPRKMIPQHTFSLKRKNQVSKGFQRLNIWWSDNLLLPSGHVQKAWHSDRRVAFSRDRRLLFTPVHVLFVDLLGRVEVVAVAAVVGFVVVVAAVAIVLLLVPDEGLDPGPGAGVDDVMPVSGWPRGQFHVSLDQKDAGVANLAPSVFCEAEAFLKVGLVFFAVGEPRTVRGRKKRTWQFVFFGRWRSYSAAAKSKLDSINFSGKSNKGLSFLLPLLQCIQLGQNLKIAVIKNLGQIHRKCAYICFRYTKVMILVGCRRFGVITLFRRQSQKLVLINSWERAFFCFI